MKTTQLLSRASRTILRNRSTLQPSLALRTAQTTTVRLSQPLSIATSRTFTSTSYTYKGLQPDTSDPKPPKTVDHEPAPTEPTKISDAEYNEIADNYMDTLQLALEEKAETSTDIEAEYSAGVMTVKIPTGTYVINKQPPNHQIWLSSPTTGPKRFDWVVTGTGQIQKEGTETTSEGDDGEIGGGKWIYLRDGTSLTQLLADELKVEVGKANEVEVDVGKEGPGGSGEPGSSAPNAL